MSLALVHARYQVLETVRVPVAVVSTMAFPLLSLLCFVVPTAAADDAVVATQVAGQLAVFAVLSVCLFTYGAGVAEERALPWDPYLRTLPAGTASRLGGRLITGAALSLLGVLPLAAAAALLTEATATPARLALGAAALVATGVPFLLLGLLVGHSLTSRAALAVAQLLLFPLAFVGGLFVPPDGFPPLLDAVSRALPSRAGRELVTAALTGRGVDGRAVPVLLAWTVVCAAGAAWAYRRDEGRRFR